jgi:hypothetical protein
MVRVDSRFSRRLWACQGNACQLALVDPEVDGDIFGIWIRTDKAHDDPFGLRPLEDKCPSNDRRQLSPGRRLEIPGWNLPGIRVDLIGCGDGSVGRNIRLDELG